MLVIAGFAVLQVREERARLVGDLHIKDLTIGLQEFLVVGLLAGAVKD